MQKSNIAPALVAIVGVLVLLLFVAYRARTFHYCVDDGERPQVRVKSNDEPCSPDEDPMEWKVLGLRAKFKLLGNTASKALGAN
jgi:hypothetical protein